MFLLNLVGVQGAPAPGFMAAGTFSMQAAIWGSLKIFWGFFSFFIGMEISNIALWRPTLLTKLGGRSLGMAAAFPGRFRATPPRRRQLRPRPLEGSTAPAPPGPPRRADWLSPRAPVTRRGGAAPLFGRRRWRRRLRPRWARRRPCVAPCTGSAAGCGSTTTRRCRKRCGTPRPSAASISWTPGSPPPPPWASTAGGE